VSKEHAILAVRAPGMVNAVVVLVIVAIHALVVDTKKALPVRAVPPKMRSGVPALITDKKNRNSVGLVVARRRRPLLCRFSGRGRMISGPPKKHALSSSLEGILNNLPRVQDRLSTGFFDKNIF
jgi:hypothetical protein